MKKEMIGLLLRTDQIRIRQLDKPKIKSMIESSKTNAKVARSISLNEESATLIFREIYESIRQSGDAVWWLQGYEPRNHEVSMDVLKEMEIKEKLMLNQLPRFKRIRNDANYRGLKVSVSQAQQIIEFWDKCAGEIMSYITEELNKR